MTGASDGNSFMTIKSKEGYYVKGTVSELMLDQVKEGTILNCSLVPLIVDTIAMIDAIQ